MPTGPKGQRRPADAIGNAVKVMRIATGEEEEDIPAAVDKDKAAVARGKLGGARGGASRANALTADQRSAIAKNAAAKRWGKKTTAEQ